MLHAYIDEDRRLLQSWSLGSPIAVEQDLDARVPTYHVHWADVTLAPPNETETHTGYYFEDPQATARRLIGPKRRPIVPSVFSLGILTHIQYTLDSVDLRSAIIVVQVGGLAAVNELYLGHVVDRQCAMATVRYGDTAVPLGWVFRSAVNVISAGVGMRTVRLGHEMGKALVPASEDGALGSEDENDDARSYTGSDVFYG
jgi:hypothetical protein